MAEAAQSATGKQRIDKWLFFSRLVKSRSLAAKFVESGHVALNGAPCRSPSQALKQGDRLSLKLERITLQIEVLLPGDRRGPASEAQTLYIDHTPPPPPKDAAPQGLVPVHGGRPEKAERRAYDRLRAAIFDQD